MTPNTLSIDVGGTAIKLAVLDASGMVISERLRLPTPRPCPPSILLDLVAHSAAELPAFGRISMGFPGAISDGRVLSAANLGNQAWLGFDLQRALSERFDGKPARVVNDADMQGFALIRGNGLELVVTLGTGFGTALFREGELMPHMELAHHPLHDNETYDQYLGDAALNRIGAVQWNQRLKPTLELLGRVFHPDHLVLAGGNARLVEPDLPPWVSLAPAGTGIQGGAALWP